MLRVVIVQLPMVLLTPPGDHQERQRPEGQRGHVPRHGDLAVRLLLRPRRLRHLLLLRVRRGRLQRGSPGRPRVHAVRHRVERLPGL